MVNGRNSWVLFAILALWAPGGCAASGEDRGSVPDGGAGDTGPSGGSEQCNGVDDDGDTMVDESYTGGVYTEPCATVCGPGERLCTGGSLGACSAPLPDVWGDCPCVEGGVRPCETECGSGVETCIAGAYSGCSAPAPAEEACADGLDNDCDGEVDEGCGGCEPGDKKRCGSDTGECAAGTRTCRLDGTWGACVGDVGPQEEICDGLDNDCDGEPDEGLAPDAWEYNDACIQSRRLPDVMEAAGLVTLTASIHPAGDEDWMWFRAVEGWHDCEPFAGQCYYDLLVTLDPPAGADLEFCLYPAWPSDGPSCDVVGDPGSTFCSDPGDPTLLLSWEGICMLDDSIDFVVVVKERPSSAPTCAPYTLSISLGGPTMVCPDEEGSGW